MLTFPPLIVNYDKIAITQESVIGGAEPKSRLWFNIDRRSEVHVGKIKANIQGGVVSSVNLDPREPSWLG